MTRTPEEELVRKWGHVVAEIASSRTPDIYYKVRIFNGVYNCNCPGYRFKRACGHIAYAREHHLTEPITTKSIDPFVTILREAMTTCLSLRDTPNEAQMDHLAAVLRRRLKGLTVPDRETTAPPITRRIIIP